jgi:hypothetical protein
MERITDGIDILVVDCKSASKLCRYVNNYDNYKYMARIPGCLAVGKCLRYEISDNDRATVIKVGRSLRAQSIDLDHTIIIKRLDGESLSTGFIMARETYKKSIWKNVDIESISRMHVDNVDVLYLRVF